MKTIMAILLFSSYALGQDKTALATAEAACGPRDVKFELQVDPSQHPAPAPESGKALIYVVQEDGITSRFGIDGKWVGANNGRTYFFVAIDPGEHHLCAIGQAGSRVAGGATTVSLHGLKAEPGMTYYFLTHIYYAIYPGESEFDLSQVDPDEGRALVARAKFSTSHPK